MESKKISFGFSKITKKPELQKKAVKEEKRVELIDCLEGQSIKIKDVVEEVKGPLIIPIKDSSKSLLDRVKEANEKRIKSEIKKEEQEEETVPDSKLSIDELAVRELIQEAKNRDTIKIITKIHTLPVSEDKFVAEGEEEPTLDDYENVPISDYGMAMLRGMGWKEGMPIGKTQSKTIVPIVPELRPKGLGLGANKMVNAEKQTQNFDKDGKELQLVKDAFAKIIAGNHKGHYCQVQGLDDENCRIIVKTAITNQILSLNEFLLIPITKEEYTLGSKVINNVKYEEYKEKSDARLVNLKWRDRSRSHDGVQDKNGGKYSGKSEEEDERHRHKSKSKKSKHSRDSDRRRKSKHKSKSRHRSREREYKRR